jgi:hypothetical protein
MRMRRLLAPFSLAAAALLGSAAVAAAQTPLVPYFGKNNVHYDSFDWSIYATDHFDIYYYPEEKKHIERVASYAESAYQQVSADLKHDLSFRVPLILFKTHSEFEQENVDPGISEGVGAFAEPSHDRMVLPIDEPSDQLYGLIHHELTHVFQFDIIPQSLIRRNYPLWVGEGEAEWERGSWEALDLMMVRDAAVSDIIPKMSEQEGYGNSNNARFIPYDLGHAVFEFIEAKYGKAGIQSYMFALRKSVIGGGEDAYEEAFHLKKDEFDQAFDRYMKDRFKPFRDKERPADYGRNLAPNPEKTEFADAFSIAPSPSGDLIATVTINRKDEELDIVLVSSKDGSVVRNLTSGFDKDLGFDHIIEMPVSRMFFPWLAWSPKGDRIAYFVRTEKERTLIVQNVLTKNIEVRIPMKSVDEPESPAFSPDGRTVTFSALRGGVGDIYTVDLESKAVVNLTADEFGDYAPTYSPDGAFIIYNARISGNYKLFRLDLATKTKTQLTFGTHDDSGVQFMDPHTVVFSSTATDPATPLDADTARNGRIFNIWTLDLTNGELRQYTDTLGGNTSAIVLNEGTTKRVAFLTYYKADYEIHALELKEPLHTVASADFGEPGPIVDFQAPVQHTFDENKVHKKKTFEKMFLEGRPPVNIGVTSNGDIFGGTAISFGDVLGDKQFNVFISSISTYRTLQASYINLSRRFQWALEALDSTSFFYGNTSGVFFDPAFAGLISRDQAIATQTVRGGSAIGIWPLDRYRRLQMSAGFQQIEEDFSDPSVQALYEENAVATGQPVFRNGSLAPLSANFISETTVFREFGPLAGSTMKLGYTVAPHLGGLLSQQTFEADVRYYKRLASTGTLALRFRGFKSAGEFPSYLYFGGNSEMHGYDYLSFIGQNAMFADAELRFPIIDAALTPIGVIGGIRGVFFANIGGGWFDNQGYKFFSSAPETVTPVLGYQISPLDGVTILTDPITGIPLQKFGDPTTITGLRLEDGRASYGVGFETFILGFPLHFDWAWRTLFNKSWEDYVFASDGGSAEFRKPRFDLWIGYDF